LRFEAGGSARRHDAVARDRPDRRQTAPDRLSKRRGRSAAEDALTQAETAANIDVVTIYKTLGGAFG
jgi:hypothetical protein